jgi:hypothetical protein
MKRGIVVLGRFGTVLFVIGLAMFLLSLIPAAQTGGFGGTCNIRPRLFEWNPPFSMMLTPQQSLRVNVEANTTITVYMLDVNATYLLEQTERNSSKLLQFLENNPEVKLWQKETTGGKATLEEYIPPKIINLLLVFSNFGSQTANVTYEITISTVIAPGRRVLTPAQCLIPIGVVLAAPWFIMKRTKKES